VSAKYNMGIGALIFVAGGVMTVMSRGYLLFWGAILFGALQFLLGLTQVGSGSKSARKLASILPEADDTQRAMCAALCGVVQNPQQPSAEETQRIQGLLAQFQFPQTPERIDSVARVVAETKGGVPGVLHDMSNAIHPDMRQSIFIGAFLVMRTGGRQVDMEKVYAIGKALFFEREKVDAVIAPFNTPQPFRTAPQPAQPAPPARQIVQHGTVNDRPYRLYSDGTVEYDSMIGPKSFPDEKAFRAYVT
jgi:hypothetical protein